MADDLFPKNFDSGNDTSLNKNGSEINVPLESLLVSEFGQEPRFSFSATDSMVHRPSARQRSLDGREFHRCSSNGPRDPALNVSAVRRTPSREQAAAITAARHLVSGNRSRFISDGYDLDLTYITPRLIAMAFPGEDLIGPFSSVIRNDLRRVSQYLLVQLCAVRRAFAMYS